MFPFEPFPLVVILRQPSGLLRRRTHPEPPRRYPAQALDDRFASQLGFDGDFAPQPEAVAADGAGPGGLDEAAKRQVLAVGANQEDRRLGQRAAVLGRNGIETQRDGFCAGRSAWLALSRFGNRLRTRPRSGTAKADATAAAAGAERVVGRRPHVSRPDAPAPAAQNAVCAGIVVLPRRAIGRGILVILLCQIYLIDFYINGQE